MNKRDFFMAAMAAEEYRRAAWVISAFSLISEGPDEWKKNPYPFRVVQTPTGYFYVNPQNTDELVKIEDGVVGQPLLRMMSGIDVKAGEVPNLKQDVRTTYGNVLYNYTCIVHAFGQKIDFLSGRWSPSKVEELLVNLLVDDVEPGVARDPSKIYHDELIRFCDGQFQLEAYAQLCVPACTRKTMTAAPGMKELREELLEKYKDRLHDPATLALIDEVLIKHQKDWMKGDPGMRFLIKNKSFAVVRKKLFMIGGAEQGLSDGVEMELVKKPLSEGWDIEQFHVMNTASRAGSFGRGSQTELGGEAVKWLFRASSNMRVTGDDCGSTVGIERIATPGKERDLVGFTIITKEGQVKVTEENVGKYLGQKVFRRSSMYCRFDKTDLCKTCLGDRLADNPHGLSVAVADTGSILMNDFMQAMHGTQMAVQKLDWRRHLQ